MEHIILYSTSYDNDQCTYTIVIDWSLKYPHRNILGLRNTSYSFILLPNNIFFLNMSYNYGVVKNQSWRSGRFFFYRNAPLFKSTMQYIHVL